MRKKRRKRERRKKKKKMSPLSPNSRFATDQIGSIGAEWGSRLAPHLAVVFERC